jgi:hypothetical protein
MTDRAWQPYRGPFIEFIRGFFWVKPAPFHAMWAVWSNGQMVSCSLILLSIPVVIFTAGFLVGRFL